MHPNRRRKKRPNYGIRTVEVARGPNGFGFTISGQQPCILSCIVKDSPADHAGLRAGDFLISVNDVSVSKTTHDAVVNLIGSCIGPIKMTIAENYYSDSSDEELEVNRMITCRKPKHKPRTNRTHRIENRKMNNAVTQMKATGHNYVLKYSSGMKEALNPLNLSNNNENQASSTEYKALVRYLGAIEVPKQFTTDGRLKGLSLEEQGGPIEYKALVGYLGTIEMPKQLSPDTRLQTVCNCIRKLRQEKRSPTAVLMTVLPTCLTLKNSSNHILAIYPTNRVVYVGSARDKDSRYFGLVTSAICDLSPKENLEEWEKELNIKRSNANVGISNSCHIFVTDPKLIDHNVHMQKAEAFNIVCSIDPISGRCLEFPKDSLYIVSLIQSMYKLQCDLQNVKSNRVEERGAHLMANSPQPSASSNSDSGIGFRDDFNTISDRIVLVEFPARELGYTDNTNNQDSINEEGLNNHGRRNAQRGSNDVHRPNFEFTKPNELLKMVLNNEKKPLNNVQNLRAYERASIKNSFGDAKTENTKNSNEIEARLNNFSNLDKLNCRSLLDKSERNVSPASFTSSDDNTKTIEIGHGETRNYDEREVVDAFGFVRREVGCEQTVDCSPFFADDRSNQCLSFVSNSEDFEFKRSADDLSMCSAKSLEFGNATTSSVVFKTPSAAFFERKAKQPAKLAISCDNLDGFGENRRNVAAKQCGTSKPNYSYEELNNFDFGQQLGYGSLNDLFFTNGNYCEKSRHIARSEPDVRMRNGKGITEFLNETDGSSSKENGQHSSAQGWATSFEKLLEDPEGVKAFAEFLKKEFSSENIDFWTSVERYRRLPDGAERRVEARRIYQQHVCVGAHEAVNVDAHGRQCAEQALQDAPGHIFDQAQKQVLNLMKFDSYPRFLKSDLYKQCLPNGSKSTVATPMKLKKSLSNAEDRRRKSVLSWHRKTRSKSKDRVAIGEPAPAASVATDACGRRNEIHSSKSSLTSLDLAIANNQYQKDDSDSYAGTVLCRVSLGNCSTTVVQIKPSESVQDMVQRLLEKRGLNYNSFEVYTDRHSKPVDVNEVSAILAGCEVRIQQRVVFKLDLPNRKTVSVKSKATKMIVDVLKPILHKYDFTVDQVVVVNPRDGAAEVDIRNPITSIDGLKLLVQLIDIPADKKKFEMPEPRIANAMKTNKLVEITNQVFESILQEKAENSHMKSKSDKGSVKSEDLGSEHSSSYFGKLLRRDSGQQDWKKKSLIPRSRLLVNATKAVASAAPDAQQPMPQQKNRPLIAKWKAGANKLQVSPCSETECNELVEGLTRAQKSRLEDQRGTEINFELPDFLKNKENDRKLRWSPHRPAEEASRPTFAFINNTDKVTAAPKAGKSESRADYENQNIRPEMPKKDVSPINTPSKQMKLNNAATVFSPSEGGGVSFKSSQFGKQKSPTDKKELRTEPPPLPPKPKIVPTKPPNWGNSDFGALKNVTQSIQSNQSLFLEQPSSSFV